MLRHSRAHSRHVRMLAIAKARRDMLTYPPLWRPRLPWGYFAKHHAFDCGRRRCGCCHWGKRFGRASTLQEIRQAMRADD